MEVVLQKRLLKFFEIMAFMVKIFAFVFFCFCSAHSLAQIDTSRFFVDKEKQNYSMVDSITVYFIGGTDRVKFKFYYEGKLIFFVKVKNSFNYTFPVKNVKVWHGDDLIGFRILRKGKYGIKFRDTNCQISSYAPNKNLIIKLNPLLKNRFAVDHYWSD